MEDWCDDSGDAGASLQQIVQEIKCMSFNVNTVCANNASDLCFTTNYTAVDEPVRVKDRKIRLLQRWF